MGRAKKNKRRKMKIKRFKSNRQSFFILANCPKKLNNIIDRYDCKSNMHNLVLKGRKIKNVNFRGAIVTDCNFKETKLIGVDFIGTNLKGTNFSQASLSNVIFSGTKLAGCNFNDAKFFNVTFVNINIDQVLNLDEKNPQIQILASYPKLNLKEDTLTALSLLGAENEIYKYHTLHIKKYKYNMLSIYLLLQKFSEEKIAKGFNKLSQRKNKKGFYTVYSIQKFLESYYQV